MEANLKAKLPSMKYYIIFGSFLQMKGESKMNNLVTINNQEIAIKEWNGQRVVTFADIDLIHERVRGTAKRNFKENRKYFIEGEDYILVTVENAQKYEIRSFKIPPRGLTLITESGYLMLVKSFTDDLAWTVQRSLVKNYFRGKYETNSTVLNKDNLELPSIQRKLYNGKPVLLRRDLEKVLGLTNNDINYIARSNKIDFAMLSGKELDKFKAENPNAGLNMLSNIRLYNKEDVLKVAKSLKVCFNDEVLDQYFYEELSDFDKLWRVDFARSIENLAYRINRDSPYSKMLIMVASKIYMDCGLLDKVYDDISQTNLVGHNLLIKTLAFRDRVKQKLI